MVSLEIAMLGVAALLAAGALLRNKAAVVGTGYTRADARAHPKPKEDVTISNMRFKFGKVGDPVPTSGIYSGLEPQGCGIRRGTACITGTWAISLSTQTNSS